MLNGNYISTDVIINKLFRDTDLTEEIDFSDTIEWAGEFIRTMKTNSAYIKSVEEVPISGYRGKLPSCMEYIYTIQKNNGNSISSMRYGSSTIHPLIQCEYFKDHQCVSDYTYTLDNGFIHTNFREGNVFVNFLSINVDSKGYPMIPDDQDFINACSWYLQYKIDYKLWRKGKIRDNIFYHTQQRAGTAMAIADETAKRPSLDQMITLENISNRMISPHRSWSDLFNNVGSSENRVNHTSKFN